jgi:hypothetical protein
LFDKLKYFIGDRAREKQIKNAESGKSGGKQPSDLGEGFCGYYWEDEGIPGSKHANYPHKKHRCGSGRHNRGDHFCWGGENWKCNATHPYK